MKKNVTVTGTKKETPVKKETSKSTYEKTNHESLRNFLIDALNDIYWAEKQLVKSFPALEKAATSKELKDAFADHLSVTMEQVKKLEQVFKTLEEKPQAKKCEAMVGLIAEANVIIEETAKGSHTRDAALIIAAQKIEHYEIATYGGLAQLAKTLKNNQAASLLEEILEEEKDADVTLTEIAMKNINEEALMETESMMETM